MSRIPVAASSRIDAVEARRVAMRRCASATGRQYRRARVPVLIRFVDLPAVQTKHVVRLNVLAMRHTFHGHDSPRNGGEMATNARRHERRAEAPYAPATPARCSVLRLSSA